MNETKRKRRVMVKRMMIVVSLFAIFALVGFKVYASPKTADDVNLVKKADYSFTDFLKSEVYIKEEGSYTFEFTPKDNDNENEFQVEIRSNTVTEGETFTFHKKEKSFQTLHLKKGTYILDFKKQPEMADTVGKLKITKEN